MLSVLRKYLGVSERAAGCFVNWGVTYSFYQKSL